MEYNVKQFAFKALVMIVLNQLNILQFIFYLQCSFV